MSALNARRSLHFKVLRTEARGSRIAVLRPRLVRTGFTRLTKDTPRVRGDPKRIGDILGIYLIGVSTRADLRLAILLS